MNIYLVSKRPLLDELGGDKQRAVELIAQTLAQALSISQPLSSPHADVHETARVAAELYFLIDDTFQDPYQPLNPFSAPLDQSEVNQNIGNFGRTARKISEKMDGKPDKSTSSDEDTKNSEDAVKELLRALFKEKGIKPIEVETRIDALEPTKVEDYLRDLETLIRDEKELHSEQGTYLYPEWGSDIKDYKITRIYRRFTT